MTELSLEKPGNHLFVRSTGDAGIRVGDDWFTTSLVLSRHTLLTDWAPESASDLAREHFGPVLELEPEVLLIGTGARQVFPPPSLMAHFYEHRIGVEVMTTEAACRTFNVLMSERRKAVAAMLPLTA